MDRVPFEEAISDDALLKPFWDTLSWPHAVTMKAFYGLPLSGRLVNPENGYSELDYWAITQGSCEYDELGYVTKITPIPYVAREYEQLWGVIGRRAGKTSQLQSLIIAYEALLGGHEEYISKKQECVIYLIAHQLGLAVSSIAFVRAIIDSSPLLSKQVEKHNEKELLLKNGIAVLPSPPSLKAQRGRAVPVAAMDEVGFWYSDPESANQDVEVERAVRWSQLQFPNAKRIGISTPWTKEGLLWKYYSAGTGGNKLGKEYRSEYENILTCFGTTASFENPLVERKKLESERREDEDAFKRESLCIFADSISGFFARPLIDIATEKAKGIAERPPVTLEDAQHDRTISFVPNYVAAMDPAFRGDSFAFCIVHKDPLKGMILDAARHWTPIKGQKLNPTTILTEIANLITPYGVQILYTDQYQLESLQQIGLGLGLSIEGVDFTSKSKAKIYGNLQQLVNQKKLELLDPRLSEPAERLVNELIWLERRQTAQSTVQISAPEGKHDDMASVLALASFKAMWYDADTIQHESDVVVEPTAFEMCMATIKKRQQMIDTGDYYN